MKKVNSISNPKMIEELINEIIKQNNFQQNFLKYSLALLKNNEKREFLNYIQYCNSIGKDIYYLAKAYNQMSNDAMKEQLYFKRHNKYRYDSQHQINKIVYANSEYMEMYMHGLAVSSFLWTQHIKIRRYFENVFPKNITGQYLEIGPGHGYFFLKALQNCAYNFFTGIDISPISAEIAKDFLIKSNNQLNNFDIIVSDFLSFETTKRFSGIVMGEVLEHVEDPYIMLRKIVDVSDQNPNIFITTCINAPMIDHIYLFRSLEEVDDLIYSAGLRTVNKMAVPYSEKSLKESLDNKLPVNVAFLLTVE